MRKLAIIALVIILTSPGSAFKSIGEERSNNHKSSIILFKFKDTGKTDEYSYYSYIIPDSIAAELKNRTHYDVRTHSVTIPYIKSDEKAEKLQEHILYLSRKGSELSAEYTISGSFEVKGNKIHIKSQLFHVPSKKLLEIEGASDEIGVLIFSLIDTVTEKINSELVKIAKTQPAKKGHELSEPVAATSPFLPTYRLIKGTTLYGEHGSMYLRGSWSDIYRDTDHYAAGLRYTLGNSEFFKHSPVFKDSAVSLSYHHFITLPGNMSSSLIVSGGAAGYSYEYPLLENFRLTGELALGLMYSTLRTYQPRIEGSGNGGPQAPKEEKHSTDPFLRFALLAGYELNPLIFYTGVSWNMILYADEPFEYLSLIFSLGFRL